MADIQYRAFTSEVRDVNDRDRSFTHAISDESVDAHGSIIRVDGWELRRFERNPIVLFAHKSNDLPIAKCEKIWKDGSRLMARSRFAGLSQSHPYAETAYALTRDGFIRAWSVGFMPKERKPRTDISDREKEQLSDPYVYTKQELMEYSLVPIPSNPEALLGVRGMDRNSQFKSWYQRSAQAYRQKTGSSGNEETIRQYLAARMELVVARAMAREEFERKEIVRKQQEDFLLDRLEGILRQERH
jgi:HK97 family phage prohead protease